MLKSLRYSTMTISVLLSLQPINVAVIREITSLEEVVTHLREKQDDAAAKPLCLLDVDFTVTRPADPATNPESVKSHSRLLVEMAKKAGLAVEEVMFATALTDQQLMEPNAKEILDRLKGLATVIGLTARYAGKIAGVDMIDLTVDRLAGFDVSFEGSSERVIFEALPEHRGSKPAMQNGIIFCNGEKDVPVTKAQVLAEYIAGSGIPYTRIFFADDTRKHLDDCEAFFAKVPGIEFHGFHYVRAVSQDQGKCTEEEFGTYVSRLISILKTRLVTE